MGVSEGSIALKVTFNSDSPIQARACAPGPAHLRTAHRRQEDVFPSTEDEGDEWAWRVLNEGRLGA